MTAQMPVIQQQSAITTYNELTTHNLHKRICTIYSMLPRHIIMSPKQQYYMKP